MLTDVHEEIQLHNFMYIMYSIVVIINVTLDFHSVLIDVFGYCISVKVGIHRNGK